MVKILYCGLKWNYGHKAEGYSYESFNIEAGLKDCVSRNLFQAEYIYPDDTERFREVALDHILNNHIDIILHVSFNEHLDLPEDVAKIALKKDIPVLQLDPDASWRFQHWILPRKHRVSHFVTTHSSTIPWYQANGMNVIKSQWGGSPLYGPQRGLYKYDVSFVGQRHGQMPNGKFVRSEIIDSLIAAGIEVHLFGNYWDGYPNWHGYLTKYEDVIDVFNSTRINLNISNPWHYGTMPQIKGRHFELPQCQAFQISTPADDLQTYFEPDKEIVVVNSVDELIAKIKQYIYPSEPREQIAAAGRQRMLAEHQWHHRFDKIFKEIGLC